MGEETRKGRAHSLRKHVFSVYREPCPVPMLCSLIWSQKKKKIKCAASSLRYFWRLENLDCCRHAVLGPELARAANVQHHVVFKYQPRKPCGKQNAPQRIPGRGCMEMKEAGSPGVAGALVSSTESVCVCMCEYPGLLSLTLPGLAPLAWLTWSKNQTILEPLDFSYPLLRCWVEGVFPNT